MYLLSSFFKGKENLSFIAVVKLYVGLNIIYFIL